MRVPAIARQFFVDISRDDDLPAANKEPKTRILHRTIAHTYPVAACEEGIHLWDATGKQYIDASDGAAVSCLGHGHPDVLAAMHAQLDKLAYAHTSFFTTEAAKDLARDLVAHAPSGVRNTVIDAFAHGSGLFQHGHTYPHGHTYLGHPLDCAGALAVQKVIRRDCLPTCAGKAST